MVPLGAKQCPLLCRVYCFTLLVDLDHSTSTRGAFLMTTKVFFVRLDGDRGMLPRRNRMKFSAFFAAIALFMLISDAQSQRQRQQQASPADERGTEQSPLVVKVTPATKSEEETAKEDRERKEKSEIDRKLVAFNGDLAYYARLLAWLAGLQLLALFVQATFLGLTLKTTARAATAAKNSSDASIALERPCLFVASTQVGEEHNEADRTISHFCDYSIENYGRSPAVLVERCVDLRYLPELPEKPTYVHVIPSRIVIYHGEPIDNLRTSLSQTEERVSGDAAYQLYLLGYFCYEDVFGAAVTTGFCYRLDEITGRLVRDGGNAYNYDSRDTQPRSTSRFTSGLNGLIGLLARHT